MQVGELKRRSEQLDEQLKVSAYSTCTCSVLNIHLYIYRHMYYGIPKRTKLDDTKKILSDTIAQKNVLKLVQNNCQMIPS